MLGADDMITIRHISDAYGRVKFCDCYHVGLLTPYDVLDNFIHRKETIEHNTNQIKLNNN